MPINLSFSYPPLPLCQQFPITPFQNTHKYRHISPLLCSSPDQATSSSLGLQSSLPGRSPDSNYIPPLPNMPNPVAWALIFSQGQAECSLIEIPPVAPHCMKNEAHRPCRLWTPCYHSDFSPYQHPHSFPAWPLWSTWCSWNHTAGFLPGSLRLLGPLFPQMPRRLAFSLPSDLFLLKHHLLPEVYSNYLTEQSTISPSPFLFSVTFSSDPPTSQKHTSVCLFV